jgi:vacuolar-type H+-ATPase subunit H
MAAGVARTQTQAPVVTLQLASDQIGAVRTAAGITTRISFTEPVTSVICGDLYDAASGKGAFVVERGDTTKPSTEVFIKPVTTKGQSNMFVKTGDGKHTYNFDLFIVPQAQAHRVVNVMDAPPPVQGGTGTSEKTSPPPSHTTDPVATDPPKTEPCPDAERIKADAEQQARQKYDEIIRGARQQADRITGEAEAKLNEANRHVAESTGQEVDRRFMQALLLGLRETKISNTRAATKKKIIITLDPRVLTFDEKGYLRYTIQNAGTEDFAFTTVTLELGIGTDAHPMTIEITQSKRENKLASGESLTGIIAFDPKLVEPKDRLVVYVRGEDNAEITHVTIQ